MKILLLDIETAPNLVAVYSLRQDYINPKYIEEHGHVLCFSAMFLGTKKVYYSDERDGHVDMLRVIHGLLTEADAVVHYNGKKFDIPTLNAEFLLHGLPPIPNLVQIDLFRLVKGAFNFPSYKLDYVSQRLGIGKKESHPGYEMWRGCKRGDKKSWDMMKRYNIQDVKLLAPLYHKLYQWMPSVHGFKRVSEYLEGKRAKP